MAVLLFTVLCLTALLSGSVGAPAANVDIMDDDDIALALRHYISEQDNVDSQKFCESEGYDVRLGGRVYQFRHCANSKFNMFCYDHTKSLPRNCPKYFLEQRCYTFRWYTNVKLYNFKICPYFGTHCMTTWSPHLSANCDRVEQQETVEQQLPQEAVGQQLTLCEELPDGKEDCKSLTRPDQNAALQRNHDDNGCLCVITPGGKKLCRGDCEARGIEV